MKAIATVSFDVLVDIDETMFESNEYTNQYGTSIIYEDKEGREKDIDEYIENLKEKMSFKEHENLTIIKGSGDLMAITDLEGNAFYEQ
jgi:predicted secreted acid phosphatase